MSTHDNIESNAPFAESKPQEDPSLLHRAWNPQRRVLRWHYHLVWHDQDNFDDNQDNFDDDKRICGSDSSINHGCRDCYGGVERDYIPRWIDLPVGHMGPEQLHRALVGFLPGLDGHSLAPPQYELPVQVHPQGLER
ncbi:hypothetical protein FRC05_007621 [Tulasnella sp. 425]|nr:hypothetical protein FRC05_007621 [Tulasnella sp. 425]